MRLYVADGRQGSALHQYEACRYRLRRELDVTPEPETEDLYREIRAQRSLPSSARTPEPPAARSGLAVAEQAVDRSPAVRRT